MRSLKPTKNSAADIYRILRTTDHLGGNRTIERDRETLRAYLAGTCDAGWPSIQGAWARMDLVAELVEWHGKIVGYYRTSITRNGYAIESEREPGSVQIYPKEDTPNG